MTVLTLSDIEERLIGGHELWRRSPGGGKWPFAGDGPWNLIRPDYAGEVSTTTLDTGKRVLDVIKVDTARRPNVPLNAAEVAERERVTAWLQLVPLDAVHGPADRALVHRATFCLHQGEGRVPWTAVGAAIRSPLSRKALEWRYRKAVATIAAAINGWPARRIRPEAAGWVRAAPLDCPAAMHWSDPDTHDVEPV